MALSSSVWISFAEIARHAATRRVVFWGQTEWMVKALAYLPRPAAYVVDNSVVEHGTTVEGLPVVAPETLWADDRDGVFVVVTTRAFMEVAVQLEANGFAAGRHFCVSPTLRDFQIISAISNCERNVFLMVSDPVAPDDPNRGGGVYELNLKTRQTRKRLSGFCHGIVDGPEGTVYLVDDSVGGVREVDSDWQTRRVIPLPPKSRPHGVAYCPKRHRLYVNLSGKDAIIGIDPESGEVVSTIQISDKYASHGTPQHHVNDGFVSGDSLYVSIFSFTGNWKQQVADGGVLEFDLRNGKCTGPVVSNLWMPHSPVIIGGALHYCDSMRGAVYNFSARPLVRTHGFIRGIAHDGEFYYVGQSRHRYLGRLIGQAENISLDTGIFIVDETSRATRFVATPDLVDVKTLYLPPAPRET